MAAVKYSENFMNDDYDYRLESKIDWALQHNKLTFQEIVGECKGAYPTEILQILKSKKFLQPEIKAFRDKGQNDKHVKELITEKIDNNPVLCSWYFTIDTCKKIADLYAWENKKILFLGMPRLFEYFLRNVNNAHFTLIDLDYYVVDKLKESYTHDKNYEIIYADINNLDFDIHEVYDFIFLDPPWYMEYYDRWIARACNLLNKDEGILIFPLFQELTRPNAEEQRKYLLSNIAEKTKDIYKMTDFVEYEIPTFENCELLNYGVILKDPWKRADLLIVKGIKRYKYLMSSDKISLNKWKEVDIFNIRIFIDLNETSVHEKVTIRYLSERGAYLKNPSKRNQELQAANMLTSRGQGYIAESTEKLLLILNNIKEKIENGADIRETLNFVKIDSLSKKIIFEILGGEKC